MSLPTDILDLILSFLQEDRAALRVCWQSHKILSQLAERYLYANISISNDGIIKSDDNHEFQVGDKLTAVLSMSPRIANYVHSFEIKLDYYSTPWDLTLSEALSSILSSFPALTKITLSARLNCVEWRSLHVEWQYLPETFRIGFLDSLRLPTIKSVSIIWISGFPLPALNGCNGVKDLTVEGWSLDDVDRPLLESLSIRCCTGKSLDRLIAWASTRNMQTLELSKLYHSSDYGRALSKSPDCLTSLDLHIGPHFSAFSSYSTGCFKVSQSSYRDIPFTLPPPTRLEHLTLCADVEFYSAGSTNHLGKIYTFISSISALTALMRTVSFLKRLTFAFHFSLDQKIRIPRASDFICIPIVGLLNECRSPSISLCVSATCSTDRDFDATFLEVVLSALTSCAEVDQLVEKGVLTIIPERPVTPSAIG